MVFKSRAEPVGVRFEQRRPFARTEHLDNAEEFALLVRISEREGALERLDEAELDRQERHAQFGPESDDRFGGLERFLESPLGTQNAGFGHRVSGAHLDVLGSAGRSVRLEMSPRLSELPSLAVHLAQR